MCCVFGVLLVFVVFDMIYILEIVLLYYGLGFKGGRVFVRVFVKSIIVVKFDL